jgi:hypothetical protein
MFYPQSKKQFHTNLGKYILDFRVLESGRGVENIKIEEQKGERRKKK